MMKKPQLFVVATPIGNKKDLGQRAVEVLKNVDLIACEDCRTSKKLLDELGVETKLVSYHKFNEKQRTNELLKLFEEGKTAALISDAGTPCISDPGRILVKELFEKGVQITAIPGASAVITFLSQIPREREQFAFWGFLPRVKNQQIEIFKKFSHIDFVFYEAANRLKETLLTLSQARGENVKTAIGRELTKVYEETICGTPAEIIDFYNKNTLKGEVVVMVYADEEPQDGDLAGIAEKIEKLKSAKFSNKDIALILSTLDGVNKNQVYKMALE